MYQPLTEHFSKLGKVDAVRAAVVCCRKLGCVDAHLAPVLEWLKTPDDAAASQRCVDFATTHDLQPYGVAPQVALFYTLHACAAPNDDVARKKAVQASFALAREWAKTTSDVTSVVEKIKSLIDGALDSKLETAAVAKGGK